MNFAQVIWWGFVSYSVLVALFMLWFVIKIREKGG
jgi:hypothetical protein